MPTSLIQMPRRELPMLGPAVAAGFTRFCYSIDILDGDIDPPQEMIGVGFGLDFMRAFLPEIRRDPLRRKIATGAVVMGSTPITFVNTGAAVLVDDQTLTGDSALLRACLQEGVRTGVSFRVPVDHGRCVSLNFYSPHAFDAESLEAALPAVFLAGHRVHKLLRQHRAPARGVLLSRRERECLEAMARGGSNGQIARDLGLSAETVKEYVRSLYRKLQVRSRAEAVSRGHALNYLGPPP